MEIIPFPCHIAALSGLVILAAHRRNLFPLVLSFMYAAFFYIVHLSEYYELTLDSQLILSATLAAILFEVAIKSKRREYIKRFCALMFLSILNNMLMLALSSFESGGYYVASQIITAYISATLSLAEFYILMRIIYGTGRGQPVHTILSVYFLAALSNFKPSRKALPLNIWQKRETISGRKAG